MHSIKHPSYQTSFQYIHAALPSFVALVWLYFTSNMFVVRQSSNRPCWKSPGFCSLDDFQPGCILPMKKLSRQVTSKRHIKRDASMRCPSNHPCNKSALRFSKRHLCTRTQRRFYSRTQDGSIIRYGLIILFNTSRLQRALGREINIMNCDGPVDDAKAKRRLHKFSTVLNFFVASLSSFEDIDKNPYVSREIHDNANQK